MGAFYRVQRDAGAQRAAEMLYRAQFQLGARTNRLVGRVPETTGQSLEQIEAHWRSGMQPRES